MRLRATFNTFCDYSLTVRHDSNNEFGAGGPYNTLQVLFNLHRRVHDATSITLSQREAF